MTPLQKQIINLLQKNGRLSRKSLGEKLNVTAAAMSQNMKLLIAEGYIKEDEIIDKGSVGRKEILLRLNNKKYFFLGIEIEDYLSLTKSNLLGEVEEPIRFNSFDEVVTYLKEQKMEECLAISIAKKGFFTENNLNNKEKAFLQELKKMVKDVYFNNNIACLAYAYKYFHEDEENFMLIKYGPGLGSASFINNKLLKNERYPTYELGKLQVNLAGDTLENLISYEALNVTSENLLERFDNDKELRNKLIAFLSLAIKIPNTLLQLDKVIVSGELFQNIENYLALKEELNKDNSFDINKLTNIENYKAFNRNKCVVAAIYLYINN